uniref:TNF receptor superfamily member 19 n=1 Tax=Oryctolagus cuniculus TaxID=9986 RepID=A0A5F9DJU8_RABIT
MALKILPEQEKTFFTIVVLLGCLLCTAICETGDCRQQEFRDRSGNCVLCKPCGPGMELSKECGFGYGEDAHCVTCRPHRFKEDWGFQKCKPCLDCALANRFQKANCSVTSDAVCGDCLPGFYRKTKLVGFQDMECVPCGDPPPPYEPHCTSKVNLVKIASTASSPRDTALAAVICSALATVLLALLILCVIYCKRQFMEKKPSWSLRSQDVQYNGSELSCFDRPRLSPCAHRACCQCHRGSAQPYGCSTEKPHQPPVLRCTRASSRVLRFLIVGECTQHSICHRNHFHMHSGVASRTFTWLRGRHHLPPLNSASPQTPAPMKHQLPPSGPGSPPPHPHLASSPDPVPVLRRGLRCQPGSSSLWGAFCSHPTGEERRGSWGYHGSLLRVLFAVRLWRVLGRLASDAGCHWW